jgi:hypothetical protein
MRNAMGRSFAACLGCIAMLTQIIAGFVVGMDTETILVRSVVAMVVAALPGWIIGHMADAVVRESIEAQYRRQIEQLKASKGGERGTA